VDLFLTKPFDPLRVRKNIDVFVEKTPPPQRTRTTSWADLSKRLESGEATKEAAPATPAARPKFDVKPRIFIVDDDEELLEVLGMALEEEFEVFTSPDGLDAVKKIPRYQPDIFVIDGMLPKMTGFQLCDTLRRSSAYREAPIIFISAKSDPKTRETMSRFGLVDYLAKPFDADQLRSVIDGILTARGFAPKIKKLSSEELRTEELKAKEEHESRAHLKEIQASKSQMKEFIQSHREEGPHQT
jgi:DNA-binding response OmpR family regulator